MSSTQVAEPVHERFHELKNDWKSKTRHLSNTAQISLVFSYQKIIGMGPAVVPLILSELEQEPDHWFWALEAITDENPVAESDAGDIEARRAHGFSGGVLKACWRNESDRSVPQIDTRESRDHQPGNGQVSLHRVGGPQHGTLVTAWRILAG